MTEDYTTDEQLEALEEEMLSNRHATAWCPCRVCAQKRINFGIVYQGRPNTTNEQKDKVLYPNGDSHMPNCQCADCQRHSTVLSNKQQAETQMLPTKPQKLDHFSPERFASIVNETIDIIKRMVVLKGGEYAGDVDRLANFRRNGRALELPMEKIWAVYAGKHWDAVQQYINDVHAGRARERAEPIEGRIDDLLVYLMLFKAIVEERNQTQALQRSTMQNGGSV